jgi:hypothetical protein
MLLSRWFWLAPLALIALACAAEDTVPTPAGGGGAGAGAPPGGTGNPTGGVSGAGNPTGGASGVGIGGAGGSGATVTGGTGGVNLSGAGGSVSGAGGTGVSGSSTGGTSGGGTGGGSGGSGPPVTCTITPTSSTSTMIPTVGIVTFTTDLAGVTGGRIEFGPTMSYGMTAPVDRAAMNNRTLLLGMKPATMYNYRIVLDAPTGTCTSGNQTIMTGAAPSGLPAITRNPMTAQGLFGGFLITGMYAGTGGGYALIFDADATIVWWFRVGMSVTGVRMSYDGKYMWINGPNVPEGQAVVHRVSMDGMTDENLSTQFTGQNHSMTILQDETVAFYAYSSNGCDDIKERSPAGMVRTLANSRTAQGLTSGMCHVNAIDYSPMDDTYLFSDRDRSTITKIRRTNGETVWTVGGTGSDFTGMTWNVQHGIDVLDVNRFLFFNNGEGSSSVAIELLLDTQAMTMSRAWSYTANPSITTVVMGDVQRLPNGNTIIAYSTSQRLHEVNAQMQLLQAWQWPAGASFGYIEKRASLYGPPPR